MPNPLLTSFNIRYVAFTADPAEKVRQLNPFFPIEGERFIEPIFAKTDVSGAGNVQPINSADLRDFLWNVQADLAIVFRVASQDQHAAQAAAVLIRLALSFAHYLRTAAEKGNPEALKVLAEVAESSTESLMEIAGKNLEAVRRVAKDYIFWPVLRSPHPSLDPPFSVGELHLGATLFPNMSKSSRFDIQSKMGRLAVRLYVYVRRTRTAALAVTKRKLIDIAQLRKLDPSQRTIEEDAALLPEFGPDISVVGQWAKLAKRCLAESYPHPTMPNEFDENAPSLKQLDTAPSHQGRKRGKIYHKLEESFFSLAGGQRSKKCRED